MAGAGGGPAGAEPFAVAAAGGNVLRGDTAGDGPAVVQLHGLTATRRHVTHGSRVLERAGHRVVRYDARGHGESDPAPAGEGYGYAEMARDLDAVIDARGGEGRVLVAGHSMGAHTAAAHALADPGRVAGLVLIGPVSRGEPADGESLAYWDGLAEGLAAGGVEGFMAVYERQDHDPGWREVVLRLARERLALHRHPEAVARALREVPRSLPFRGLDALEALDVPALVVASHDDADPGHPYAVAREWAERLPRARLVSEEPGDSPLAWQGGRLSREIAAFAAEDQVAERL